MQRDCALYSCVTGRGGSGGTIAAAGRSFAASARAARGGVDDPARRRRLVERQAGADPLDLLGVERLAREQRVGHVEQRLLVLGQDRLRARRSCR